MNNTEKQTRKIWVVRSKTGNTEKHTLYRNICFYAIEHFDVVKNVLVFLIGKKWKNVLPSYHATKTIENTGLFR